MPTDTEILDQMAAELGKRQFYQSFEHHRDEDTVLATVSVGLLRALWARTPAIPVNALHASCPACGEKVDIIPSPDTVVLK